MYKATGIVIVGGALIAACVCGAANAEDPARAFIDRVAGPPLRIERTGPSTTRIESNPAQDYIDRLSSGKQMVAERLGPGTTSITRDTQQEFVDRVSGARPLTVERSGTGSTR